MSPRCRKPCLAEPRRLFRVALFLEDAHPLEFAFDLRRVVVSFSSETAEQFIQKFISRRCSPAGLLDGLTLPSPEMKVPSFSAKPAEGKDQMGIIHDGRRQQIAHRDERLLTERVFDHLSVQVMERVLFVDEKSGDAGIADKFIGRGPYPSRWKPHPRHWPGGRPA